MSRGRPKSRECRRDWNGRTASPDEAAAESGWWRLVVFCHGDGRIVAARLLLVSSLLVLLAGCGGSSLVHEEHELWDREAAGTATEADRRRLQELNVALDQCWDVLRQRRALRDAGRDPADASVRSREVVEHYKQ